MTLPSDLAAIRARCEKATPGRWESTDGVVWIPVQVGDEEWEQQKIADSNTHDATFIAHARTDLPRLLARLEEMRGVLITARAWQEEHAMHSFDPEGHRPDLCNRCVINKKIAAALRPLDAPG